MLNLISRSLFKRLHPVLKPLSAWYLSKVRRYSYRGIKVKIYPGVFHPGLFFSTKILIQYLSSRNLNGSRLLELGAGSGLISLYCSTRGALVTASDINPVALNGIRENCLINNVTVGTIQSDLFDAIDPTAFDFIVINPPYYPKQVQTDRDLAWYCGENFEYFRKLFSQLSSSNANAKTIMILSQDCDIDRIAEIARDNRLILKKEYEEKNRYETNFIFSIEHV